MPETWVYAPYSRRGQRRLTDYWVERHEREAAQNWDLFYKRHADRFFKDRHYLAAEWPELAPPQRSSQSGEVTDAHCEPQAGDEMDDLDCGAGTEAQRAVTELMHELHTSSGTAEGSGWADLTGSFTLLEAGCGVGNTLFPLLRSNPSLRVFAVDFADSAVSLVRDHASEAGFGERVCAAVGDLTMGSLPAELGGCLGQCDAASLMFVLSAISPARMCAAIAAVASSLRPGGVMLVRDYAQGDGAQQRFQASRRPKQLDEHGRFFVRQDGTRAYYFEADELAQLVVPHGFQTVRCEVSHRSTVNRAKGVQIDRRFITATFRKAISGQGAPAMPRSAEGDGASAPSARAATGATARQHAKMPDPDPGRHRHAETNEVEVVTGAAALISPPPAPLPSRTTDGASHTTPDGGFGGVATDGVDSSAWQEVKCQVRTTLAQLEGPAANSCRRRMLLELLNELEGGSGKP